MSLCVRMCYVLRVSECARMHVCMRVLLRACVHTFANAAAGGTCRLTFADWGWQCEWKQAITAACISALCVCTLLWSSIHASRNLRLVHLGMAYWPWHNSVQRMLARLQAYKLTMSPFPPQLSVPGAQGTETELKLIMPCALLKSSRPVASHRP